MMKIAYITFDQFPTSKTINRIKRLKECGIDVDLIIEPHDKLMGKKFDGIWIDEIYYEKREQ